ncbi:neutral zinc metallopeptidase [Nocardia sp. bgisy118]|uniref:neutral zinc metallopeptidase n=1 Tax=Nocardia sp. bgisy118 TaxID=3413786 RepID=UPI003F49CA02
MTTPPYGYGHQPHYPPPYGPPPGYAPPPGYPLPGYPYPGHAPAPYGPPPGYGVPPYGPPGYGRPYPPPRRGGGGVGAVFGVLGIFLMVGALVAAAVAVASSESENDRRTTAYTPSYTYTPTIPSSSAATTTSAARPTTAASSPVRTTSATPTRPAGPQPVAKLGDHPLFTHVDTGLNNIQCTFSRWAPNVAAAQAFFQSASTCLGQMWKALLDYENLPFSPPNISVPARGVDAVSPCTSAGGNYAAFYCSMNNTIYMPLDKIQTNLYGDNWVIYLTVFAHEYGHHVQAISGISKRTHEERYNAGPRSARGLELSRRMELGAQCFGGMFIGSSAYVGSVSGAQGENTVRDNYTRGDNPGDARDHGSKQNYGLWYEYGYRNNRVQKCNSWVASADAVS